MPHNSSEGGNQESWAGKTLLPNSGQVFSDMETVHVFSKRTFEIIDATEACENILKSWEYEKFIQQQLLLEAYIGGRRGIISNMMKNYTNGSDWKFFVEFIRKEKKEIENIRVLFGDILSKMKSEIPSQGRLEPLQEHKDAGVINELPLPGSASHDNEDIYSAYYESAFRLTRHFIRQNDDLRKAFPLSSEMDEWKQWNQGYQMQYLRKEQDMQRTLLKNWINYVWDLKKVSVLAPVTLTSLEKDAILERMLNLMCSHFHDKPHKQAYAKRMMDNFVKNSKREDSTYYTLSCNKDDSSDFSHEVENIVAFMRTMNYEDSLDGTEKIIWSFFIEPDFKSSWVLLIFKDVLLEELTNGTRVIHLYVEPNSPEERLWRSYWFKLAGEKKMPINDEEDKIFHHYSLTDSDFLNSRVYSEYLRRNKNTPELF